MFEITSQRWDAGRLVLHRIRPLFETREQAETALNEMKRNKKLIYKIREVDNHGN